MAVTLVALLCWAGEDIHRACISVVLGSSVGGLLTLACLAYLRIREGAQRGVRIPVARRLAETALPLAVADDLKVGINTIENLMVPKRLSLFTPDALAQFGMVGGMVFPVIMFPAAILYGLADLLIPELARCNAAQSRQRIRYLARRSLRTAAVYGVLCGGVIYMLADVLARGLYHNDQVAIWLRPYALLVPMLYCDAIIDAMNKGLGQQKICVRLNIFTALLDVAGLYVLLPRWGMQGYWISFFVTHALNAALSLRLLLKTSKIRVRWRMPLAMIFAMAMAILFADMLPGWGGKSLGYVLLVACLLVLTGAVRKEDGFWLRNLVKLQKFPEKMKNNV